MHLDFIRVVKGTTVNVAVPAVFANEDDCKGLRRGGVLNVVRYEIEVTCEPDRIPTQIEVDLSGYDIGDSIHISAVKLPEGGRADDHRPRLHRRHHRGTDLDAVRRG